MDFDSTTAFAQHFSESSFELRPETAQDSGAKLFLSFSVVDQRVSLGAYDYGAGNYSHEFSSSDPDAVAPFIAELEAKYGVSVPEHFRRLTEEFLTKVDGSFGVHENLQVELRDCELCGINENSLEGFYYPPLVSGGPASLGLHYSYGCYSGDSVYGDPTSVGARALAILSEAIRFGDAKSALERVRAFEQKLKTVLIASGIEVS